MEKYKSFANCVYGPKCTTVAEMAEVINRYERENATRKQQWEIDRDNRANRK